MHRIVPPASPALFDCRYAISSTAASEDALTDLALSLTGTTPYHSEAIQQGMALMQGTPFIPASSKKSRGPHDDSTAIVLLMTGGERG